MDRARSDHWFTEASVNQELQQQPHLYLRLMENAMTVAESLRGNYFSNTAKFVAHLRQASARILQRRDLSAVSWLELKDEIVTFIDGGVGQVQISSQVPILLRVGSYSVRTGERRLAEREQFGYYPIVLGDIEGGTKTRKDFIDIVRITAELLGALAALERTPNLRVLMVHGPLVYRMGQYAGHTPFTEADIDLFLNQYGPDVARRDEMKTAFLREAQLDIYPRMVPAAADDWSARRVFEPLAWIAFLLRRLIAVAQQRRPPVIVAGVVERGNLTEFSRTILLERVFRGLREKGNADYFNKLYGRRDLTSEDAIIEKLGYTDGLLLAMLMRPGECSEPWTVDKYGDLRTGWITLPDVAQSWRADWSGLRPPSAFGFPEVMGCYVHVLETTEPIRVEVFRDLGSGQIIEAARRAYLYARLLPGYGFPVGLDIADKYAHVPAWLTDAYSKLIRFQLSASLQRGEIKDAEMQRILVQAIYMTHRDWIFRPEA